MTIPASTLNMLDTLAYVLNIPVKENLKSLQQLTGLRFQKLSKSLKNRNNLTLIVQPLKNRPILSLQILT